MLTADQLKRIFIHAKQATIEAFLDPINDVMQKYEINTPLRQAHFLAQIGHESGELKYKEEIASGMAYEGREDLGNTEPGDGPRFKGRGLIQLTGRSNYKAYGVAIGWDLIESPQVVATDSAVCTDVAGWFWRRKGLSELADQDGIERITRRINGGLNGLEDRKRILRIAKEVLGC